MPEVEGMNMVEFISGFVAFFGIIVVAYSVAYLFAGIGVSGTAGPGAACSGIIVGILSGLIWLSGVGTRHDTSRAAAGQSRRDADRLRDPRVHRRGTAVLLADEAVHRMTGAARQVERFRGARSSWPERSGKAYSAHGS